MNDECARAAWLMPLLLDRDLAGEDNAWLDRHLAACAECRSLLDRIGAMDGEVTELGRRIAIDHPAPAAARTQIAARIDGLPAQRGILRWIPAVATAIAAAIALFSVGTGTPKKETPSARTQDYFIEIPYLPPPAPQENLAVVRMEIRVGTLMSMGYRVTADPEALVPAEVLVGEDGRAHAVRVLSDVQLTGTGD